MRQSALHNPLSTARSASQPFLLLWLLLLCTTCAPRAFVSFCRSDPARSTRFNPDERMRFVSPEPLTACTLSVNTCDTWTLRLLCDTWTPRQFRDTWTSRQFCDTWTSRQFRGTWTFRQFRPRLSRAASRSALHSAINSAIFSPSAISTRRDSSRSSLSREHARPSRARASPRRTSAEVHA